MAGCSSIWNHMSRIERKPDFCLCENKGADQLHSYCEADQRFCFRYTDIAIPLLSKSKLSNLYPSTGLVQASWCWTWSETPKTGLAKLSASAPVNMYQSTVPTHLWLTSLILFNRINIICPGLTSKSTIFSHV